MPVRTPEARERERVANAERMRQNRHASAEIEIPKCANPSRRKRCLADPVKFLRTYFPERFYLPFTDDQLMIISEVVRRAKTGGDQAIADSRGGGKTEILTGLLHYLIFKQLIRFPVIIAANTELASDIYNDFRDQIETNNLLNEDFPEVCHPIRALEGVAMRATKQHIGGERTRCEWKDKHCILPTVPGSPYGGVALRYFGLDKAIRGVRIRGIRPDFVLIDDPETEDSAQHQGQIDKRERLIDRAIAGLAGPDKSLTRVMLCTIQNTYCLAAKYTDPKKKSAWNGKRLRLIKEWPTRTDLWEEYIFLRHEDQANGLENAPAATALYLKNRETMDAGAVLANPHRYNKELGDDGQPLEHSALQRAYNFIADNGLSAFMAEVQNDPEPDDDFETPGLTASIVQKRVHGGLQGEYPEDAQKRVLSIDLGKFGSHWIDTAHTAAPASRIVDYGVAETWGLSTHSDKEVIEAAILRMLLQWREEILPLNPDLVLVDSGTFTAAAYEFIRQVGGMPFIVCKGWDHGRYRRQQPGQGRIVGENWNSHYQKAEKIWLYNLNMDHWWLQVHQRFLTRTFDESQQLTPGSLSLFSAPDDKRKHVSFSHHIMAQEFREEFKAGKGITRFWHQLNKNNHWGDSMAMNLAGSDMLGCTFRQSRPVVAAPASAQALQTPSGQPFLITERS